LRPYCLQLLLERYDWRGGGLLPGASLQRQRLMSGGAATLELPRGRHVLRLVAPPDVPHALTVYAAPPCSPPDAFRCAKAHIIMLLWSSKGREKDSTDTLLSQSNSVLL
jgi:hypothetical protein